MTICSPEAGNIDRERNPKAILPVEGEQIVILPSHKSNNCFIMPINIFSLQFEKKTTTHKLNTDQHCVNSFAVKLRVGNHVIAVYSENKLQH